MDLDRRTNDLLVNSCSGYKSLPPNVSHPISVSSVSLWLTRSPFSAPLETSVPMCFAADGAFDVAVHAVVEHQDRQVVFHALGDGRGVHDAQVLVADLAGT